MIDHRHYVPLLKWKRGEQRALKEVPADIKASFTPIFEVCFNADPDTGLPASPVAELVDRAVDAMFDSWPKGRPFFLDAGMFAGP